MSAFNFYFIFTFWFWFFVYIKIRDIERVLLQLLNKLCICINLLKEYYLRIRFSARNDLKLQFFCKKLRPYNNLWQGNSWNSFFSQVKQMKKQATWICIAHFEQIFTKLHDQYKENTLSKIIIRPWFLAKK